MRPQQNPGDPSTPRPGPFRGTPPLFSPTFSRSTFPAPASAAVVSEHPCVTLREWWLARVEGHERKIAVAGFFERNQAVLDFTAAPIAKCHEPYVLETENGTVVFISGIFSIERTLQNGFTVEICEKFSLGFPENWNVFYAKMMRSQTGSQPRSSRTRFYLERFQEGKLLDSIGTRICNVFKKAEAFSVNSDAFPDSSHLPSGAPRFEEYNWDDDTPTIEKSTASNHYREKAEDIEIDLIGASTLKERSHDDIDSHVHSVSTVECTNDDDNVGMDNALCTNNGRQKTHVASMKRRGSLRKPQRVTLSESVPSKDTPTLAYSDVQSLEKGNLSLLTRGWPKSFSMSTPESLELKKTRSGRVVVPTLDSGCQNIAYASDGSISAIIASPPPLKGSTLKNYARKKKRTN